MRGQSPGLRSAQSGVPAPCAHRRTGKARRPGGRWAVHDLGSSVRLPGPVRALLLEPHQRHVHVPLCHLLMCDSWQAAPPSPGLVRSKTAQRPGGGLTLSEPHCPHLSRQNDYVPSQRGGDKRDSAGEAPGWVSGVQKTCSCSFSATFLLQYRAPAHPCPGSVLSVLCPPLLSEPWARRWSLIHSGRPPSVLCEGQARAAPRQGPVDLLCFLHPTAKQGGFAARRGPSRA